MALGLRNISRSKAGVAVGVGVVGLALIGVGAGATFTDSVDASQSIATGNVSLQVTKVTFQGFDPSANSGDGGLGTVQDISGNYALPANSVDLGSSDANGSTVDELYTFTLKNFGSLPVTIGCYVTGSDPTGNSDVQSFADSLYVPQYDSSLYDAENDGNQFGANDTNLCLDANESTITLAPGDTVDVPFEMDSQGSLSNRQMGQTVDPTYNVQATEARTANNAPNPPPGP